MRLLAILCLAAGCTASTPKPPVLDDLQMPQSATVGASGFYEVSGLLSFHDDDDYVAKIRIRVPLVATTYEYDAPPFQFKGTFALTIKFASTSPKGPVEYDVSLVDTAGLESVPVKRTVNLN